MTVMKKYEEKPVLTQDQISKLQEAFKLADKDGDLKISKDELLELMSSLEQTLVATGLEDIIEDAGAGWRISYAEFLASMRSQMQAMRDSYRVFDQDGDGNISAADLKYSMGQLGENLTDEELQNMMAEADTDGDGLVSFDEFFRMMTLADDGS